MKIKVTTGEQKDLIIQDLADRLRTSPFQVDFVLKKNPAGIKVIIEVTQEQMDMVEKQTLEKQGEKQYERPI